MTDIDFYLRSMARFDSIFKDLPNEQKEQLRKQLNKIDKAIENDRGYYP